MTADLIRFVESISSDKQIERETVFADLEAAMVSAAQRAFPEAEDVIVQIDRMNGDIGATVDGAPIDMKTLGRIAAQTAKQVMMQKIREDERNSIFEEYSELVGTVVTGTVARYEGGSLTVNLGRAEGFLPRSEQIPGDVHQAGERIRAMVLDVREEQSRVKIVLTQTHPDYIRKLFELEVPEVAERIIEIKALAREAGYRTKIAVSSIDTKVDAVGACVGVRGSRIRNIVDELGGEKIDIVRWNESSQVLISNALKPAEVRETFLCFELGKASVLVEEDQLSLAIGKRGQNVRLAARLTGWDLDITSPADYDRNIDEMDRVLKGIEGIEDVALDKMIALGIVSVGDLAEVGVEPLIKDLGIDEALAAQVLEIATVEAKRIEAERDAARAEARRAAAEPKVDSGGSTEVESDDNAVAKDGQTAENETTESMATKDESVEGESAESVGTEVEASGIGEATDTDVSQDGDGADAASAKTSGGQEPPAEAAAVPTADAPSDVPADASEDASEEPELNPVSKESVEPESGKETTLKNGATDSGSLTG